MVNASDVSGKCSGLAQRILRNFDYRQDSALVISSSGCSIVTIEIAQEFQSRGIRVVAIISRSHSGRVNPIIPREGNYRILPIWFWIPAPPGDAMVKIDNLDTGFSGSTLGECFW